MHITVENSKFQIYYSNVFCAMVVNKGLVAPIDVELIPFTAVTAWRPVWLELDKPAEKWNLHWDGDFTLARLLEY